MSIKEFDHQTEHYNGQGQVIRHTPYRLRIDGGRREYERPPLSGMWYNADGSLLRDDSAEIKAKQAAEAAEKAKVEAAATEQKRVEERAALRKEILAEVAAENKAHTPKKA